MCWWVNASLYTRSTDDLRLLADLFRIHLGAVVGRQIYTVVSEPGSTAKHAYTIDNEVRPAVVAMYMTLLDPEHAPDGYAESKTLAMKLSDQKEIDIEETAASAPLIRMINVLTCEWFRSKKNNARSRLDSKIRMRIKLFAEILTRAAQTYQNTLERNRILWDQSDLGYIGDENAHIFNCAFDMHYITLAVESISRTAPKCPSPTKRGKCE